MSKKPIENGVRCNLTVPKERVEELKLFAKTLQQNKPTIEVKNIHFKIEMIKKVISEIEELLKTE